MNVTGGGCQKNSPPQTASSKNTKLYERVPLTNRRGGNVSCKKSNNEIETTYKIQRL
jgi:hypothetical protein